MGRAIVREPQAFLMDEPLSNLDAKLRVGMRASLAQLHARLGVTTVYVTHDQTEAMTLGQRVAVMRDGHIVQVDEPQRAVRRAPRTSSWPAFIGSPAMNLVEASLEDDTSRSASFRVPLDPLRRPAADVPAASCSGSGPRPSRMRRSRGGPAHASPSTSTCVEELGAETHAFFPVDAARVAAETAAARTTTRR